MLKAGWIYLQLENLLLQVSVLLGDGVLLGGLSILAFLGSILLLGLGRVAATRGLRREWPSNGGKLCLQPRCPAESERSGISEGGGLQSRPAGLELSEESPLEHFGYYGRELKGVLRM